MKTSNLLLLTLFILFFGSFFAVGWNAEANVIKRNISEETNINLPSIPIADFSVIVAEKGASFSIFSGTPDEPSKIMYDEKYSNTIYSPNYEVRRDTLFIRNNPNTASLINYDLIIECNEIKSFIGKPNSDVTILNPFAKSKQLFLLDHAKLTYHYNGEYVKNPGTKIEKGKLVSDYPMLDIKITANQSDIAFRASKSIIDLDLDLNKSYFHIEQNGDSSNLFNKISGSIKNDSRVDLSIYDTSIFKINLKGDKTSSFNRSNINK